MCNFNSSAFCLALSGVFERCKQPECVTSRNVIICGVAKVRKEASFRERKVPFAEGGFWLRNEVFFYFAVPV